MSALRKILVVDDDPVVGKSFSRVLSNKGYAVITAANAQEALARLEGEQYDAVYTDIRMPGMDGLELAEQVKAKHPWMPVVIVTGYGSEASEARAKAAGVSAFLHKPLSPEMIEDSAAEALYAPAIAMPQKEAAAAPAIATAVEAEGGVKQIALLLAGPFIGLAYILLLPFVGLGYLAGMAVRGLARLPMVKTPLTFLKNVGLFIAAPFIGLAYVVLFPLVGAVMLAWVGMKALRAKGPAK